MSDRVLHMVRPYPTTTKIGLDVFFNTLLFCLIPSFVDLRDLFVNLLILLTSLNALCMMVLIGN